MSELVFKKGRPVVARHMSRVILTCAGLLAATVISTGISYAEEAGAAAHDAHHAPYSIWSDLPFWSFIAFIGFVIAVKKLGLWDLMTRKMGEREQAESEAIQLAERDLTSAQTLARQAKGRIEALDQQIREIFAEAQRDADSTRQEILAIASRESELSLQRVNLEVDRVKSQALNEIFSSIADKITATAEQRLRAGLQPQDHDRLVREALQQATIQ